MQLTYPIGDVSRISGAATRTVQFWVENDVLLPEEPHGGKGVRRSFPKKEVAIACVIQAFADRKVGLQQLVIIAKLLRDPRSKFMDWLADGELQPIYLLVTWAGEKTRVSFIVDNSSFCDQARSNFAALNNENSFAMLIRPAPYLAKLPK